MLVNNKSDSSLVLVDEVIRSCRLDGQLASSGETHAASGQVLPIGQSVQRTAGGRERVFADSRPRRAKPLLSFVVLLLAAISEPVLAKDFTFRRVGVPSSGSTNRITVQIGVDEWRLASSSTRTPEVRPRQDRTAPARSGGGASARAAGVEWFWNAVSPLLSASRPERLEEALTVIAGAPSGEITEPQSQALQDMARLYGADILRETADTRVSPALVLAVMSVESAGRSDAISHAGAAGLMQLMPATAARFGVGDRLQPGDSIRGGVAYLDWLLNHFGGDPILALAAYNAGEGSVENNGGVPPYSETRAYVPKVLASWRVARDLCETPPELASDECVFKVDAL